LGSLQHRFGNAGDRRPASAFPPVRFFFVAEALMGRASPGEWK